MKVDRATVYDLLAEYGGLIDAAKYDEWLDLFAEECRYQMCRGRITTGACRRR